MADTKRKIHPSRFGSADQKRNIWHVVPEDGTVFDDVLAPVYWAHLASRLRPTDRIEVHAEDGSYFAELVVRSVGNLHAKVQVIRKIDFDVAVEAATDIAGHEVMWKGPHHRHAVVRGKDIIQGGFETKDAAFSWLATNAKSLAA